MKKYLKLISVSTILMFGALTLTGCGGMESQRHVMSSSASQLQMRTIQTRSFETSDRELAMRTVIATLQDLGFVIDKADLTLGSVSATKLSGYSIKATVTIRLRSDNQITVRMNAQYGLTEITDPVIYQDFFISLEKSMFLTAHEVD